MQQKNVQRTYESRYVRKAFDAKCRWLLPYKFYFNFYLAIKYDLLVYLEVTL